MRFCTFAVALQRALLAFVLIALSGLSGVASSRAQAASDALYGQKVVLAQPLSKAPNTLASAVDDLRSTLTEMTGAEFNISVADDSAGPAIVLSLSASAGAPAQAKQQLQDKALEPFVIEGDATHLRISANDERGLAYGVYYYLEQLGARWLLPGDAWTDIPHRGDIRLTINRLVEPSFKVRSYAGTGGFFSYWWGRKYQGSVPFEARTLAWQRRLRYGGEYWLGKHVGEAFISDKNIAPILREHPEYLASVNGQYAPLEVVDKNGKRAFSSVAKVNAGNPDAVALFCNWTLERLRVNRKSPDKSLHNVITVEPSDGYDYGTDVANLPGNGSGSDQSFFIANECAKTVRKEFPDASVILLAYAGHAAPPSFALEPNVIVQVTPYGFQDTPPDEFIASWKAKTHRLTLYDYWSIPDWSNEEPTFDYLTIAAKLRGWRADHIEGLNAESSFGAGAMGPGHYVAAHLMWDLGLDEHALIEEWYDRAFGPARAPMKDMLERWAHSFKLTAAELGASYLDLEKARALSAAYPAASTRVADYVRYVHALRLRYELDGVKDKATAAPQANDFAAYLLNINTSQMVHATRLIDLYSRRFPNLLTDFSLANPAAPGPGWQGLHTLSDSEVMALLADGLQQYPIPDYAPTTYGGPLTALPHQKAQAETPNSWGPVMSTISNLDVNLEVSPAIGQFPLRISRLVDLKFKIIDETGKIVMQRTVEPLAALLPDANPGYVKTGLAETETLTIALPPGRYTMRFQPSGGRASGYFSLQTWASVPLTFRSFLSPKTAPSPRMYFFVPYGQRQIVMYYPNSDYAGAFKFEVLDPEGKPAALQARDGRRTLVVQVPPGMDGRIWSLNHSVSPDEPLQMLSTPQAFSLAPELLRVPRDAL